MKKTITAAFLLMASALLADISLQCDRVLRLYRSGDTSEFRIDGPEDEECAISIVENDAVVRTETVRCPATIRMRLSHPGVVRCTATAGDGKARSLEVYVDPEERIAQGKQQRRSVGYQRYGNIVNEYYVSRFRELHARRQARLAALATREEAEAYVQEVRQKIRECFGISGEERTPLNPQITGTVEFPLYRLEKVLFESRPGFYVTGNFYLPKNTVGKVPGVLMLCGHSFFGKTDSAYAKIGAVLASNGIATFTIDPIGQGERLQYSTSSSTEGVYGHNELGKKLAMAGEWLGAWRAFDAVRGLDYLLSRPEIDSSKVYATGCSGGGTLTTWLTAVDDRLAGAIPSCFVTCWKNIVENELPCDAEQIPPALAGQGIDISDFLIAAAPRPVMVLEASNDYFDARGCHQALENVRKIYRLLGVANSVDYFEGIGDHGYNADQREACFEKIAQWTGLPYQVKQEQVVQAKREELLVAPQGQILNIPNAIPAEKLAKQRREGILASRPAFSDEELENAVRKCLGVAKDITIPGYRSLRNEFIDETNTLVSRFLVENDKMVLGELRRFTPLPEAHFRLTPAKSAFLYIPHWNSLTEFPRLLSEMEKQFEAYYSFDPFGVGSLTPSSCNHFGFEYGDSYGFDYHFAALGVMLGESYLGRRVEAILNAISLLRASGVEEITLCGAGRSTVAAAFAAFLAGAQIQQTVLVNPMKSYREIPTERTQWSLAEMPFGILKITDLPEIYDRIHPTILERPYTKVE